MSEYSQDRFGISVPAESTYAWVITHVNPDVFGTETDDIGTMGPSRVSLTQQAMLSGGGGHTFRLLDDDGIWYYRGRIIFDDHVGMSARPAGDWAKPGTYLCIADFDEGAFGPLWDFGAPNAGCTTIQYRVEVSESVRVWAVL